MTAPNILAPMAASPRPSRQSSQWRRAAGVLWNLERLDPEVRKSQSRRRAVFDALRQGDYFP